MMKTDALTGGFAEPVFDAQSVFKMVMDCMARPSQIATVRPKVAPPEPMGQAAGAIALTLCDHDTAIWLGTGLAKSPAVDWLGFHTGAPLTKEKVEARFAFLDLNAPLCAFGLFAAGTQEYPDRSTTVVIEIASLEGGPALTLSGPGIDGSATISPVGLPDQFLRQWADNKTLFPRGIDVVLTAGDKLLCLPRTVKIASGDI
jgi:alpha-D-ribose 1-methylphosphonate 5-triphosphate synthase subunit PhnH